MRQRRRQFDDRSEPDTDTVGHQLIAQRPAEAVAAERSDELDVRTEPRCSARCVERCPTERSRDLEALAVEYEVDERLTEDDHLPAAVRPVATRPHRVLHADIVPSAAAGCDHLAGTERRDVRRAGGNCPYPAASMRQRA